jgi:soluble lytic murein transglycosylase-like protein
MHRRRRLPPDSRIRQYPIHPTGPARRRWPRAYDGGLPAEEAVKPRYRRAYDEDFVVERRRQGFRRSSLESLRQSPIRNGLIGLAVAGAAAPIAINRHQQALRTDPSHEAVVSASAGVGGADDPGVAKTWQDLQSSQANALQQRESIIVENISKYADYDLTRDLAEEIYDEALANDIDPQVAFGLVRAESSFRNASTSPVGAVGLTQLMPKTASWLEPGVTRTELRDPGTNLRIGFKYLRSLIDKYEGDTSLALVAYNRGPGTVDRDLKRGRDPDNGYADFVYGKENHGHRLYTKG